MELRCAAGRRKWPRKWRGGRPLWLSGLDSNQDKLLQRELCYLYTTGQQRGISIAIVGDGSRTGPKKNRRTGRGREVF